MKIMRNVYISATNVLTALGTSPEVVMEAMLAGQCGIHLCEDPDISSAPFWASRIDIASLPVDLDDAYTRFERLIISSVSLASRISDVNLASDSTLFLLSTTKGNIDELPRGKRLKLHESAAFIAGYFGNRQRPVVVSNACISGTAALLTARRIIQSGQYKNVVVAGADLVSSFVLSGFQSFKALSEGPCKPFDSERTGLSLGEGAGTIILSAENTSSIYKDWIIAGGGISNDANHISGPSRTGEGLRLAVEAAISDAGARGFSRETIGYISAHGTATLYNDEMEAKAINAVYLQEVPLSSYKGYWGHTLGAAGLIETAMALKSVSAGKLLPSLNYSSHGVSSPLHVLTTETASASRCFLKTSSGFGGCNAALLIGKI